MANKTKQETKKQNDARKQKDFFSNPKNQK